MINLNMVLKNMQHASVDINHSFILATTLTPALVNDTNYRSYCTVYSRRTKQPIEKVYADKGYAGKPNRDFLAFNKIAMQFYITRFGRFKYILYQELP